jgi:hypothetical protein
MIHLAVSIALQTERNFGLSPLSAPDKTPAVPNTTTR